MKRRVVALSVTAVLAVTASLAYVAGRVTSPAQRAAAAAAPTVSPATAQAQLRVISAAVVGRGSVTYDRPETVDLSSVSDDVTVVTHNPLHVGTKIRSGDILLEVAGHPVIALSAPFSPYRDLHITDSGRDVRVLKSALRGLGYAMSEGSTLTAADMDRVARLVTARGYTLPREPDPNSTSEPSGENEPSQGGGESPDPEASPTTSVTTTAPAPQQIPVLPRSWWVGLRLPARVASPGPRVGKHLSTGASPKLTRAAPVVKLTLPAGTAERVTEGTRLVFIPADGEEVTWKVTAIRQVTPGSASGSAPDTVLVAVKPAPHPSLIDTPGKVTLGSGTAHKVLAVPLTAIVQDAAGQPAVRVRQGQAVSAVAVQLGDQADGWVEVTPDGDALAPGAVVELG